MCLKKKLLWPCALAVAANCGLLEGAQKEHLTATHTVESTANPPAVLWRNPKDIRSRNLYYGPGGKAHEPQGPFTFVKEDRDGSNPKFVVRDEAGVKWKVKMGEEARPETAASRLVWAVGYFSNEDYFLADLRPSEMPERLHRGQKLVAPDGSVHAVRLKRELKGEAKAGTWRWKTDPFTGPRELNGLRVVMALINNWDLKDENNAVYEDGPERIFMISDLGSSFGTAGPSWPHQKAKGNLESYTRSKFMTKTTAGYVDFQEPARPSYQYLLNLPEYFRRKRLEWIGRRIPVRDVQWIGELLSQLSVEQIRDAFRASGYTPEEVNGFAGVVEDRIRELKAL